MINVETGLHIQIVYEEPGYFDSFMTHYGKFSGVRSYIALVGKKSADLDEKLGYYGEKLDSGIVRYHFALGAGKESL